MKAKLIAVVFGFAHLVATPSLASAQYTFGVPSVTTGNTDTLPPSQGR